MDEAELELDEFFPWLYEALISKNFECRELSSELDKLMSASLGLPAFFA